MDDETPLINDSPPDDARVTESVAAPHCGQSRYTSSIQSPAGTDTYLSEFGA